MVSLENAASAQGGYRVVIWGKHEARKRRTLRRAMMTLSRFQGPALSRLGDKENRFQHGLL